MQKLQKVIYTAIIASETSHVFCCVLPTLFSILSLMSGFGLIVVMPAWLQEFHAWMHHRELPMIALSGLVMLIGWGLYSYSRKIDCHNTGCRHGACKPKKDKAFLVLKIATVLFIVNTMVYLFFHRTMPQTLPDAVHHAHVSEEAPAAD